MLEHKTLVVTGAAGALGKAVCGYAEKLGARTARLDIAFSDAADKRAENCHEVDLTDREMLVSTFATIGHFDAVLNVAGGFAMGADAWADDDDWNNMFKINVGTLRNVLAVAVPLMLENGSGAIVNVGAYGAREGQGAMSAYTAAKSTVMRITQSLAAEVREKGVNVNAVLPTVIDTPANRQALPDEDPGLWVSPDDLASVMCFLASDAARAVHGALIPVRGLS